MAARPGRQFARRQPGRTNWARIVVAPVAVAATSKVLLTLFTLDNPGISETVRRTRGRYLASSGQSANLGEIVGAWGAVVVTDAAAAIGITAIPGPITDASDDNWFIWEPFLSLRADAPAASVSASTQTNAGEMYDSKAMRKVATGFQLAFVVESFTSEPMRFGVGISLLSSRG